MEEPRVRRSSRVAEGTDSTAITILCLIIATYTKPLYIHVSHDLVHTEPQYEHVSHDLTHTKPLYEHLSHDLAHTKPLYEHVSHDLTIIYIYIYVEGINQ